MNNDVILSIVIPVHNGKKYLKKIATLILGQSIKNIELILVEKAEHREGWQNRVEGLQIWKNKNKIIEKYVKEKMKTY